jgi:hypothetical protein
MEARFRRLFFSPPHEPDKPRVGITKDPVDGLQGAKTGEPICIRQSTDFGCVRHSYIMPKSCTSALPHLVPLKSALQLSDDNRIQLLKVYSAHHSLPLPLRHALLANTTKIAENKPPANPMANQSSNMGDDGISGVNAGSRTFRA